MNGLDSCCTAYMEAHQCNLQGYGWMVLKTGRSEGGAMSYEGEESLAVTYIRMRVSVAAFELTLYLGGWKFWNLALLNQQQGSGAEVEEGKAG